MHVHVHACVFCVCVCVCVCVCHLRRRASLFTLRCPARDCRGGRSRIELIATFQTKDGVNSRACGLRVCVDTCVHTHMHMPFTIFLIVSGLSLALRSLLSLRSALIIQQKPIGGAHTNVKLRGTLTHFFLLSPSPLTSHLYFPPSLSPSPPPAPSYKNDLEGRGGRATLLGLVTNCLTCRNTHTYIST